MTALILIVVLALAFDFVNGFHDAANSIATVVSTRVLSPRAAVVWAAMFNFIAFLVFSTHVAGNIAKGVDPHVVTLSLVAAGLVGAIVWDLLTWWWGLPTSSSHALLGGIAGAAVVKAGFGCLDAKFFGQTAAYILVSPLLGGLLGFLIMRLVMFIFGRRPQRAVDGTFRRLQLISAAFYSLGHGGNDAQKTIGIIWMLLIAAGYLGTQDPVPIWVIAACYITIAFGTAFGGWRIVKTMGQRITKLRPVGGCCAETGGAITLFLATALGIPVSTTHTITGAIIGVGAAQNVSAVRWGVAGNILWAWILTIPCSAFIAGAAWYLGRLLLVPAS